MNLKKARELGLLKEFAETHEIPDPRKWPATTRRPS